jgi:hypothetical protein
MAGMNMKRTVGYLLNASWFECSVRNRTDDRFWLIENLGVRNTNIAERVPRHVLSAVTHQHRKALVSKRAEKPKKAAPKIESQTEAPLNSTSAAQKNGTASEEAVRLLAYQKWEAAGKPAGDGSAFWEQAERELLSHEK